MSSGLKPNDTAASLVREAFGISAPSYPLIHTRQELEYEYRIKSSGLGPATYGACERCGKQCPCHYMQQSRRRGQIQRGWASAGFGHVECLRTGPWVDAPVTHDSKA